LKKNKISKNWLNKQKRDPYFKKSKIEGYRSRSAFKLIELDNKFKFITKNSNFLDLGSSPGGWSQVAAKKITNGKIMAIDLKDMTSLYKVNFVKTDITNSEVLKKINKYFGKKIDIVVSDIAVSTSGNKDLDSYNTGSLCLSAMQLATEVLDNNGVFVGKLFMGSIFPEINKKANNRFKRVVRYKPLSSKSESREIYIYCKGLIKV